MAERLLIMFLKEPVAGKVKTRLGAAVGMEEAARRYQVLVTLLLKQLKGLRDTRLRFCFAPDDADEAIRFWILPLLRELGEVKATDDGFVWDGVEIDFRAQGEGDLGDRLERAFSTGFEEGFGKVAAIGSDCVDLGSSWVNAAFRRLAGERELVYGPSPDGGYGFLGVSRFEASLFRRINWSATTTLSETLSAAEAAGMQVEALPELRDVDTVEDWTFLTEGMLGGKIEKLLESQA